MRLLLAALLLTIGFAVQAQTTFTLISDPVDTRTDFIGIEIDGVEVTDCGTLTTPCMGTDGSGLAIVTYDVTSLISGPNAAFTVRARTCIDGGICSSWTVGVPFDFTAPQVPTGLGIVTS